MFISFAFIVLFFFVSIFVILKKYIAKKGQIPKINEKFVLVTGCDSGIGKEAAIALDSIGFQVFAACLTSEGESHLKTVCSSRVRTLRLDVTKHEAIEQVYSEVKAVLPSNTGNQE